MTSIPGGSLTLTEPLRFSSNTPGFSSCGTDDKEEEEDDKEEEEDGKEEDDDKKEDEDDEEEK